MGLFQLGQELVLFVLVNHLYLVAVVPRLLVFDADDDFYEIFTGACVRTTLGYFCVL